MEKSPIFRARIVFVVAGLLACQWSTFVVL